MGIIFGPGSLFESLTNPSKWWDHFKNGTVNDVNLQIENQNLQYQKDRNAIEDARYEDETAYNREFAENEREYNRAFAEDERAWNRGFAERQLAYNRKFAEDERDYNRALQQQIFRREDTAIERQAQSLSKLGINPLSQSMNGLGAGQVISSSAPSTVGSPSSSLHPSTAAASSSRGGQALHNNFQMQDPGNLSAVLSFINSIDNINTNGIQRDLLLEQKDFQRLQNESQAIENAYKSEKLSAEIEDIKSSSSSKRGQEKRENEKHPYEVKDIKATSERNERENKFQEDWNLTDNTNSTIRTYADLAGTYNTFKENRNKLMENTPLGKLKKSLSNSAKDIGQSLTDMINSSAKKFKNYNDKFIYKLREKRKKWTYSSSDFEKAYHK